MTRVVFSLKTGGYSFWPKQFLVSPFLPSRWEEKKEEKHTFHRYLWYGGLSFVFGFEYIIKFAGQTRRFWDCSWRKMVKIVEGNFQRKGQESPLPPLLIFRQSMWSCPVHQKLSVVILNLLSGVCEPEAASCYGILYFVLSRLLWYLMLYQHLRALFSDAS